ncbi:XRE family transcriptional regulator [Chryseobacterium nematophagum]|uniref:XRE family transcriptional regulator n=1 Tax=Chryseobacterium nematophagum TaxID=2305228 RepID=A0A3M7L6T7_9FLAO|nr:helix-turn-helix transcriptional regulator [Chryseobacterium nematophagum]RMZ58448.1 XRE family transcriptional regulator [Chryseobacterium nematophagum]
MIKNEKQYTVSKSRKSDLEESLLKIKSRKITDFDIIMIDALESQIGSIEKEILEYVRLKEEKPLIIYSKIEDLPKALIKARIVKGLTHKDIANLLGIKEQQIQRYEAEEYSSAKFERIIEIANLMDIRFDNTKVNIDEKLVLKSSNASLAERLTIKLHTNKSPLLPIYI